MFDPRSIVFFLSALSLLMAIVLFAMPSSIRKRLGGAWHWSVAMALLSISAFLFGWRGIASDLLAMVLANAVALLSVAMIYAGGRAFFGLSPQHRQLATLVVLSNLALLYGHYVEDLFAARVVIFSVVSCALLLLFSLDILRHCPHQQGRARFPYLFTAITIFFDVLVSILRIIGAMTLPASSGDFFAPTLINVLYFSTHSLLAICISVGFILMLNERLHALLEHQLSHDPLTQAYSRAMLIELSERELASPRAVTSILLLDIDHFKRINDNLGHLAGDAVLKHFVQVLMSNLRADELLGRYGGEEFMVLLRNSDEQQARATAERLRERIATAPYALNGVMHTITVSIGCATTRQPISVEQLLRGADSALYRAKHAGRNRVEQD